MFSGIPLVMPLPVVPPVETELGDAGMPVPVVTPLPPTSGVPLKSERPPVVVPAKPSSVPISWAKERDAETTRASISTCCDLRSSWRIRLSICRNDRRNVANDQLVRAIVGQDVAARAQEFLQRVFHRAGLAVAQHASHGDRSHRFGLRLFEVALQFPLPSSRCRG